MTSLVFVQHGVAGILYYNPSVSDVTQILEAIESGDAKAASELLPLVYGELRQLAKARMRNESSDHTLDATSLVHEAYIRLVGSNDPGWHNRGHFFAAAAEAMRRILIDSARRKSAKKHGGEGHRVPWDEAVLPATMVGTDLIALDEAMTRLEVHDAVAAKLVKLRFFAGLNVSEAAQVLNISTRTAERNWTYARAWLHRELLDNRDQR